MDLTPGLTAFDQFYANRDQAPPWVIGEPQPAVVSLVAEGLFDGRVLDIGCGAGEHTILLTRKGIDVVGVDGSPAAVEQARRNAEAHGVAARFEVADALHLAPAAYDTVLDSALFHIFDDTDRAAYVASVRGVTRPGSVVHLLALSDAGRGFGPQVSEATIRSAFTDGWGIEALVRRPTGESSPRHRPMRWASRSARGSTNRRGSPVFADSEPSSPFVLDRTPVGGGRG